jgi:hypothetical protein
MSWARQTGSALVGIELRDELRHASSHSSVRGWSRTVGQCESRSASSPCREPGSLPRDEGECLVCWSGVSFVTNF